MAFLPALVAGPLLEAATIRVPADHPTIQEALDAAAGGDTVLVAPGEYVLAAPIDFNRLHDPGDPASPRRKDLVLRSSGGPEATVLRMSGTPLDSGEASVVVFESRETRSSRLEGFTITGGTTALLCGPGSAPTVRDSRFVDNRGWTTVRCVDSDAVFEDCVIEGNDGRGVTLSGGAPRFTRVRVAANRQGGIAIRNTAGARLTSCRIVGNSQEYAGTNGGGLLLRNASPTIEDSLIARNTTQGSGGGLYAVRANPTLEHVTISGNYAAEFGSGICLVRSRPVVRSSIVWENAGAPIVTADDQPGFVLPGPVTPGFTTDETSEAFVSFSCLDSGEPFPGAGNIDLDPRFCGYSGPEEVHADSSRRGPGSGTRADPYGELAPALAYSLSLAADSPCRGTGAGGSDMGASLGSCPAPGVARREVHLAPGTYDLSDSSLVFRASLIGSGAETTALEGTAVGLRGGERIEGLTITGGLVGGVLVAAGESPRIIGAVIDGNHGSGIVCPAGASPEIRGSDITSNDHYGIHCSSDAAPTIEECLLRRNLGALGCVCGIPRGANLLCGPGSAPLVVRSEVSDGLANGVRVTEGAEVTIIASRITGSVLAGVSSSSGGITLSACEVTGNRGGGIELYGSTASLDNCLIAGNGGGRRQSSAPALSATSSTFRLESSTVASHRAAPDDEERSAVRLARAGKVSVIRNSIVWEDDIPAILTDDPSKLEVRYSLVSGGREGEGNLEGDPLFVRPGAWEDDPLSDESVWLGGDFRLRPSSPAIDAGTAEGIRALDLDGKPRLCGGSVDLGAYELSNGDCPAVPPPPARFTVTPLEGEAPLRVRVDAGDSLISRRELTGEWDFGDGATASGIRAEHTYTLPGTFTVTLTVRDERGRTAVSRADVHVIPRLGARFTVTPSEGEAPLDIAVDASSSTVEGLTVTYEWDFGDGAIASGVRARHAYTTPGTFPVTLTVRDQNDRSASAREEVRVLFLPRSGDISPWTSASVGRLSVPGAARLEAGCLVFTSAGSLLGSGPTDRFHFLHRALRGNVVLTARISDLRFSREASVQAGLMLRGSLDPEAPFGAILLETSRGVDRLVTVERNYHGGDVRIRELAADATSRIRIERDGLTLKAYVEHENEGWSFPNIIRLQSPNRPVPVLLGGVAACGGEERAAGLVARACVDLEGGGLAPFHRGDVTANGRTDLSDAVALLGHLFLGDPSEVLCASAADVDDNARLEVTDGIRLLAYLFLGGLPPERPFESCGVDETGDALFCGSYPPCE